MLPSLFVSRGLPARLLTGTPAKDFLRNLGRRIDDRHGRPKAIVMASFGFHASGETT